MLPSQSCRLCLQFCNNHHSLYDEDDRLSELYTLMQQYFSPVLLNAEYNRHLTGICTECWLHLYEFHTFQQSVHLAHVTLSEGPEAVDTADKGGPMEASEFNAVLTDGQLHNEVRYAGEVLTATTSSQGFGKVLISGGYPNQQSEVIVNPPQEISLYDDAIPPTPIATDWPSHSKVRSGELLNHDPEDLKYANSSSFSLHQGNISCSGGEEKVEADVPLEAFEFNSNPPKVECHNEGRSREIYKHNPEDLIYAIASNCSQDRGNISCNDGEEEVEVEIKLAASKYNGNPPKAITTGFGCHNEARSGEIETPSTEDLIYAIASNCSQDRGNISCNDGGEKVKTEVTLEGDEFNSNPPKAIAVDFECHNEAPSGEIETPSPEDLIYSIASNCSQDRGNISCNDGGEKVEAEITLEGNKFNSNPPKAIAADFECHNEARSGEIETPSTEDLIYSIASNCSQDRGNNSCNDGGEKVKTEVSLEGNEGNSNPPKAIAADFECHNDARSGEIETPSPKGLKNSIISNISHGGDTIQQSESGSEVLTKNIASTFLQVRGSVSCDMVKFEESDDPDEEWEEFDDPVGVFAGGEFDKPTKETVETKSESLSESEWPTGSCRSDHEVPPVIQTRQRKLEPLEHESKNAPLSTELERKAKRQSITANSNDNFKGSNGRRRRNEHEKNLKRSKGSNERRKRNEHEENLKRPKSAPEFNVTSESEGSLAQVAVTTRRAENAETKRDKPRDVHIDFESKPKPTASIGNSSETNNRLHTTDLEVDVSESESDEDFSSDDEMSAAESTGQTSSATVAAKSGELQSSTRKNISYKKNIKRLQTVQEFDDYIAHWRPNLECVICRETCSSFSLLRQHFEKQHPKEECHIECCQHKFYHRYEIEKHIHFHNEPKAFKCEFCYKCFTLAPSLRDHLTEKHAGKPKGDPLKCPNCARCYSHKSSLRSHMKYGCNTGNNTTSTNDSLGHTCGECGKVYKTLQFLKKHKRRVHLGLYKNPLHKCSICDKVYKNGQVLVDHMTTHTGQPTNTCPYCPKSFVFRSHIYRHLKEMHRKEWDEKQKEKADRYKNKEKKVYQCTSCENVYSTSLGLVEHRATHAGQRLYTCSLCPKTYKYASNVSAHFRRMHFKEWQNKKN